MRRRATRRHCGLPVCLSALTDHSVPYCPPCSRGPQWQSAAKCPPGQGFAAAQYDIRRLYCVVLVLSTVSKFPDWRQVLICTRREHKYEWSSRVGAGQQRCINITSGHSPSSTRAQQLCLSSASSPPSGRRLATRRGRPRLGVVRPSDRLCPSPTRLSLCRCLLFGSLQSIISPLSSHHRQPSDRQAAVREDEMLMTRASCLHASAQRLTCLLTCFVAGAWRFLCQSCLIALAVTAERRAVFSKSER